jgi:hypothetical protein
MPIYEAEALFTIQISRVLLGHVPVLDTDTYDYT